MGIIDIYFKTALTFIASGFAVYFAFQKLTTKVVARYVISNSLYSAQHISKLVLTNKKDKTICIWSAHAIFEKDIQMVLDEFDPPLILKPYETISLSLPKFTNLSVSSDKIELDYNCKNISLYLDIGDRLIKCVKEYKKDCLAPFIKVSKYICSFGEHVYNENVVFIFAYRFEGKTYTAFILKGGFIGNEWNFAPNSFGKDNVNVEDIKNMIEHYGFDKLFTNYLCYRVGLPFPSLELVFKKLPD